MKILSTGGQAVRLVLAVACVLGLAGSGSLWPGLTTGRAWAQGESATTRSTTTRGTAAAKAPTDGGRASTPESVVPAKAQEVRDENDEYLHSPVVVKMGAMLGMGPGAAATAFTVFNFIVLAVGVGFVVLKILPKALRERSTRIQRQLVEARTATEEANGRLSSVEQRLSRLDGQIAAMRAEAEQASEREGKRLLEAVEEEKAKILAAADAEIQAATVLARRKIQQHAAELAIEQAARRLTISAETDRALIGNFARQLSGEKGGQN